MFKELIFVLCFSFLSLAIYYHLYYGSLNLDIMASKNNSTEMITKTKPLILFYTPKFEEIASVDGLSQILDKCPFKCQFSNNPLLYPESDLAIFHSRDMKMDNFLLKYRNSNRLNVYYTTEAYPHEKIRKKYFPKDFFNLTRTHRSDSEQRVLYGRFENILPHEKENDKIVWSDKEVEEAISRKNKLAVIIASHCITHSYREKLIEDMKRYTNISTFGKCYNSTMFNKTEELGKHFFNLAFENAVCKDYVTEKFWRIKDLIVPVVLKRSLLKGIVEDEYFIAADDFNSTKALVEKLENVSKNLTEYKKYFGWTKKYKKTASNDVSELCRLCEIATKKEKHIIPDIYHWWEKESECQFNYLNFTLEYLKNHNLLTIH